MTVITLSARHKRPAARAVPWTRLAWVSWRQHRGVLIGAAVFLGVIAVYLAITGYQIHQAYDALGAAGCPQVDTLLPRSTAPVESAPCQSLAQDLLSFYGSTTGPVGASGLNAQSVPFLLLAVPVLLGAFAGAPALARELESGTFRFAWTQGAGRTRWALARLALPAVMVTAAAAAFSQLFGWFYYPFFATGDSALAPQYFELTGIAFAAWTLAAFAIGTLAGVLIRKVVPAIAAAMAAWAGLLLVTSLYLRRLYQAPLNVRNGGHGAPGVSPWLISQWWTGPNGKTITSENKIIALINHPQPGYTQWTTYEPGTRYWHFQFIEGGWLLVLSLLLIAAAIWLVRRRAA